jgi:hypothetical protein
MASRGSKDESAPEAREVAAYVATLAQELKEMVEPHGMKPLAYLLDLVRLEAEQCAGSPDRVDSRARQA